MDNAALVHHVLAIHRGLTAGWVIPGIERVDAYVLLRFLSSETVRRSWMEIGGWLELATAPSESSG